MAKRKIVWTETAARQRREILRYWIERNNNSYFAEKLIKVTASHIKIISKHPHAFKESEIENVHESSMGHFSIYYKSTSEQLIILAFWDNRQDPKELIKAIRKNRL